MTLYAAGLGSVMALHMLPQTLLVIPECRARNKSLVQLSIALK